MTTTGLEFKGGVMKIYSAILNLKVSPQHVLPLLINHYNLWSRQLSSDFVTCECGVTLFKTTSLTMSMHLHVIHRLPTERVYWNNANACSMLMTERSSASQTHDTNIIRIAMFGNIIHSCQSQGSVYTYASAKELCRPIFHLLTICFCRHPWATDDKVNYSLSSVDAASFDAAVTQYHCSCLLCQSAGRHSLLGNRLAMLLMLQQQRSSGHPFRAASVSSRNFYRHPGSSSDVWQRAFAAAAAAATASTRCVCVGGICPAPVSATASGAVRQSMSAKSVTQTFVRHVIGWLIHQLQRPVSRLPTPTSVLDQADRTCVQCGNARDCWMSEWQSIGQNAFDQFQIGDI